MSKRNWCDTCRGDGSFSDALLRCTSCPRRFHKECAGLRSDPGSNWSCPFCAAEERDRDDPVHSSSSKSKRGRGASKIKKRIAAVRKCHKELKERSRSFLSTEKLNLQPFVDSTWFQGMVEGDGPAVSPLQIGPSPPFVRAVLRSYQVKGVNWLLSRYAFGTGCIVADGTF